MTKTARRIAAPLALAAALAGATSAYAAPTITTGAIDEGDTLLVNVNAKCTGAPKCQYTITTVDDTATNTDGETDYVPATIKGSAKKKKTFARTLSVGTLKDGETEDAETFIVRVTVKRGARVATFDAKETINASDQGGGGTTVPNPNAVPPDSGEPTPITSLRQDGFVQGCETPFWTGVQGQAGAWGNFQKGCTVTIQCPFRVKGCAILAQNGISSEKKVGQRVTMNSRLMIKNTSGKWIFREDRSCDGTDSCQTTHLTRFDSGAVAQIDCNGVRATGPLQDRAKIVCGALVQFEDDQN